MPQINAISFLNNLQAGKVNAYAPQKTYAPVQHNANPQTMGNPNRPECRDDVHGANIYCLA